MEEQPLVQTSIDNKPVSKPFKKYLLFTMFVVIAALRIVYSVVVAFLPHHIKLKHQTIKAKDIGLMLA